MDPIQQVKPTSDKLRMSLIFDSFANVVELAADDATCFFALTLLLCRMTNLSMPADPAKLVTDLNKFMLDVPLADDVLVDANPAIITLPAEKVN